MKNKKISTELLKILILLTAAALLFVFSTVFLILSAVTEAEPAGPASPAAVANAEGLPAGGLEIIEKIDTMLAPAGPASQELPADKSRIVDLKDCGAKGNGSADDTAAFRAAVAAAGGKYLLIPSGTYRIASSAEVPENVTLCFAEKAVLKLDSGAVLTVNSAEIIAPKSRIFDGSGTVGHMPNIKGGYTEWFGADRYDSADDSAAFRRAINAVDSIYLLGGDYVISQTVQLPQGRSISVYGIGYNNTYIYSDQAAAFEYIQSGTAETDFSVGYFTVYNRAGYTGTFLSFTGTGSVDAEAMYCHYYKNVFKLTNSVGTHLNDLNINNNVIAVELTNCKNTTVEGTLTQSSQSFIVCNGGENLYVIDSSGVWDYGTDYDIRNFKNFSMVNSSTDLAYNHTGKPNNDYGIYLEKVSGFEIRGCWVAANSGLSFTGPVNHIGLDGERTGIYIKNSDNGLIAGSSINNSRVGIGIYASPAQAKKILIEGNSFNGNGKSTKNDGSLYTGALKHDIYFDGAANVGVEMNFFSRYPSGYNHTEVKGTGTAISFVGNSFRYGTSSNEQLLSDVTGTDITVDSNMYFG